MYLEKINSPEDVKKLLVDEMKDLSSEIRQVLLKKLSEHGGHIGVSIYDKENHILISVRDTGAGIPQDMFEKIFNPFVQVDASFRRHAEGSGIGLALVKSLVEMHEGEIAVRSELGIGSEFIIKLPIKLGKEKELNEKNPKASNLNLNVEKTKIEFSDIYF
jgi:signal transduction histidine kinase